MNRLLKLKWQQEENDKAFVYALDPDLDVNTFWLSVSPGYVDSVRTPKSDCDAVGSAIVALPELIDRLQQVTALARVKYGNLDPDVDQYLKETEALIALVTGS